LLLLITLFVTNLNLCPEKSLLAFFVMPRLTAELVASSPQFMNPLKERELDLRGNSIPAIENLGAARVRRHACLDCGRCSWLSRPFFVLFNLL
jgi:hypothetical protein